MEYKTILDSLFEIYEGAYRAGQVNPNAQDNTKDDSLENEQALDKLYDFADKLYEVVK